MIFVMWEQISLLSSREAGGQLGTYLGAGAVYGNQLGLSPEQNKVLSAVAQQLNTAALQVICILTNSNKPLNYWGAVEIPTLPCTLSTAVQ